MSRAAIALRLLGALAASVLCALACAVIAHAAVGTARGQRLDQLVLTAGQNDTGPMAKVVFPVLNTVTIPVIVAALAVAAAVALLERRTSMVAHLIVLVAGATVTTQVLKHLVIGRRPLGAGVEITPNSFPSGHTTVAAAVAVAVTLASPRRLRSVVAIAGAAWTAIAGIGTIAGGWHRPSDVVGALLVVGAWTYLVLAVDAGLALLRTGGRAHARIPDGSDPARVAGDRAVDPADPPVPTPGRLGPPLLAVRPAGGTAVVVLGALGILGLVGGALLLAGVPTPLDLDSRPDQALAYTAATVTIAGAAAALVAWVLLVHIPAVPRPRRDVRVR